MLIGVPGSGKSTWIQNQFEDVVKELTTHVASTDDYIEYIAKSQWKTYDEVFKDNIKEAEKRMYKNVASAVEDEYDIIWDQTNLTRKSRAKKLIMIPDHYIKIAQFFPVPEMNELARRIESRPGKTIPAKVLQSMIENIEFPCVSEGFHQIVSHGEFVL